MGLLLAAAVPVVGGGGEPAPATSDDFHSVATRLVNSGDVQLANLDGVGDDEVRVRMNAKDLGAGERRKFVDAVLALKKAKSPFDQDCPSAPGPTPPCLSYYDQFVQWHKDLNRCDPVAFHAGGQHGMSVAHGSPVFLPWHRVYLILFEKALRDVSGKNLSVPYWDWTDPQSTAGVFRDDFMGRGGDPNDGFAITGPFNKQAWKLNVHPEGVEWSHSATEYITRRSSLPERFPHAQLRAQDVREVLEKVELYDAPPYDTRSPTYDTRIPRGVVYPPPSDTGKGKSFRNTIEGFGGGHLTDPHHQMQCGPDGWMALVPGATGYRFHQTVHAEVGGRIAPNSKNQAVFGTMAIPTSPNDPVFFLHHANVDRLWAEWQAIHGVHTYQPQSGYPGKNADDVIEPFKRDAGVTATPRSVEDLAELGYRYE